MAFEKKIWKSGDVITYKAMNRLEEQIEKNANGGGSASVTTGIGLTSEDIDTSSTIKVKLKNETALTNNAVSTTEVANRVYPVAVDNNGDLAVNVPWTDYTAGTNIDIANGTISVTGLAETYAPLASPALTGIPTAPTANAGTDTAQIATTEFVTNAVNNMASTAEAMIFKGTINSMADLPAIHEQGWTYKITTAGLYIGTQCEVGDMVICITSGTATNNSDWIVVQTNSDGTVIGPTNSVNNHIAVFNGTTGKVVKDSGFTIETSVPNNAIFTDTHRPIQIGGNQILGNDTTPLNLIGNNDITVTENNGTVTISGETLKSSINLKCNRYIFNVTLPTTGWTEGTDLYSISVTVNGILASDEGGGIGTVQSGVEETDAEIRNSWNNIVRVITANDSVTFYAINTPTVAIPLKIEVFR